MKNRYVVYGKFPNIKHGTYYCHDWDDVHDAIFIIKTNGGEVTWIGEKTLVDVPLPNGLKAYEYREIKEAYK
jgi:hypothetical protein